MIFIKMHPIMTGREGEGECFVRATDGMVSLFFSRAFLCPTDGGDQPTDIFLMSVSAKVTHCAPAPYV